ncbi:MAG: hypothetical protein MK082_06995 [Phycisphaerales bacterium]|nr:hypothetical protein [Phycisphaerales bacterium]
MPARTYKQLSVILLLLTGACSTTHPNRNPVGETFPEATGATLEDDSITLPTAYEGEPALYMVGYVQATQFDLDRWAIGFTQVQFPCRIVEVPTIPNAMASMFKGMIDNGMRSGIPREDWVSVVTLYGDEAQPVVEFTGNENPRNGRILLIDADGVVRWFWDQGFSAKRLMEVDAMAKDLAKKND